MIISNTHNCHELIEIVTMSFGIQIYKMNWAQKPDYISIGQSCLNKGGKEYQEF